jgi:replicative DNA helicase
VSGNSTIRKAVAANKQPPVNLQAEMALLGAILVNNQALSLCAGLAADHFYDPVNACIFAAAKRRIEAGRHVDAVTLKMAFENRGELEEIGGTAYLVNLITCMVSTGHIAEYASAIMDCSLRRRLIGIAENLQQQAYGEEDGADSAATALAAIEEATAHYGNFGAVRMGDAVKAALVQSDAAHRGDKAALGLSIGIPTMDALWNGLHPGSLEIIGARSGEGKTALARQIARHNAIRFKAEGKGSVAIFSMEMTATDIGMAELSSVSGMPTDAIRTGSYETRNFDALLAAQRDMDLPIDIIDTPALRLSVALSQLRALKRRGMRLAIFDHRNLFGRDEWEMRLTKLDWYQQISQRLKAAAKAVGVPVILLVQLSRQLENREDPRPRKSDLEYTGEADADNIVLLYRKELHMGGAPTRHGREGDEAFGLRKLAWFREFENARGSCDAIFVKRRFGPLGIVPLVFDGPSTTFKGRDLIL